MPSPFPGMNPYLEQESIWPDFHNTFVPAMREELSGQVRPAYSVRMEEYLYIHELSAEERFLVGRADLSIARRPTTPPHSSGDSTAALAAPAYATIPPTTDVERHAYLEIRDREDQQLVTVIELLSPSNKRAGPDREHYLAKRRRLFSAGVHLVEIDLLRGYARLPLEDLPDCDYYALVGREEERPRVGVWPIRLRDPLPIIPVPLRNGDRDAILDLKKLLDRVYDAAGYDDYVYRGRPQPPLHPEDAIWARAYLPASA